MKAYLLGAAATACVLLFCSEAEAQEAPPPPPPPQAPDATPTPAPSAEPPPAASSAAPSPTVAPEPSPPPPPTAAPTSPPAPAPHDAERRLSIDADEVFYKASALLYLQAGFGGNSAPYAVNETVISSVLGVRYRFPSAWQIEAEIPTAVGYGGEFVSAFGNVALGAMYTTSDQGPLRFQLGVFGTLPTAPALGNLFVSGPSLLDEVRLIRGFDRAWLWIPHSLAVAPTARLSGTVAGIVEHATEASVAPMLLLDPGRSAEVAVQLSEEVAVHVSLFRAGVRGELAGELGSADTRGYLSLMPFAGITGKAGFLDVGALFDLINPQPYNAGNFAPNWGLRVRGGLRF